MLLEQTRAELAMNRDAAADRLVDQLLESRRKRARELVSIESSCLLRDLRVLRVFVVTLVDDQRPAGEGPNVDRRAVGVDRHRSVLIGSEDLRADCSVALQHLRHGVAEVVRSGRR